MHIPTKFNKIKCYILNNVNIPLTFTAEEAGSTITLNATGSPTTSGLQYRYGTSGGWSIYTCGTTLTLENVGDCVQFQNTEETLSNSTSDYVNFSIAGKMSTSGNIQSMLNYSESCSNYCYYRMFNGCTGLTTAPELPATTLADYCYSNMFFECTGLTTAPALPATTLADYCYESMFRGCTGLTSAPELPATTLANQCYGRMFRGCTGLTTASELPTTTLADYCYQSMFYGCTSLTSAPLLPATTLADYCYSYMFSGCRGLTTAPKLPATTLADNCYRNMFQECTGLTTAPELHATTLADYCYSYMFSGCTGLTTAPELPATTLANYCYESMFYGCTSLTSAPELPATTLASWCYESMFEGCTRLTTAPELPATTLTRNCYSYMFERCTKLTSAPELPATTLASYCYNSMFYGCTKLNYINVGFTEWNPSNATNNWVNGVASSGTFECPTSLSVTYSSSNIPEGWTIIKPLTFTAEEAGSTVKLSKTGSPNVSGIQYRFGTSGDWNSYICGTTLTLENIGDTVQFQNTEDTLSTSNENYVNFSMTGKIAATGNIQSMLNYSESCSDYCYRHMFNGCTSLTSAPELPATTLATYCYSNMFFECTGLTTAPALPATTLADYCYSYMFYGCTKLNYINVGFTEWNPSNATEDWVSNVASTGTFECHPSLSVTYGSSNILEGWTIKKPLTFTAEEAGSTIRLTKTGSPNVSGIQYRLGTTGEWLPYTCGTTLTLENIDDTVQFQNTEDTLSISTVNYVQFSMKGKIAATGNIQSMLNYSESCSDYCYYRMFYGCYRLTSAPELPATTLDYGCYQSMFEGCYRLTSAPKLPATTLASSCYSGMFYGCTGLTSAPALPATTLAGGCYADMFWKCTGLTSAPALPATTLVDNCYSRMFYGCTSLTAAPELPATTFANYCYQYMFSGCTKLNYIKVGFIEWNQSNAIDATTRWVSNVSSTGTFECPEELDQTRIGDSRIPTGWTVVNN